MNRAITQEFGIDLSRSWALAFVRRAAPAVLFGLLLLAWVLSGVTALGIDERAIYERFGVPVRVFGPGIHVHLPWPFGLLREAELGVVHDMPIVQTVGVEFPGAAVENSAAKILPAEAAPAPSDDRLWDRTHPSEASYLVASETNGQQNFEIVDVDLRVVYRLGLSDEGAMSAVYGVVAPGAMVRAEAGRILAHHFARYTLLDLLGQDRADFVDDFKAELQARLDGLRAGVEIIAVVVEAIHPPPGAASAYHLVQAAEISSVGQVSQSRGEATRRVKGAEKSAIELRDHALAEAAERTEQARATGTLFDGDRQAFAHGGRVFLFERWLSQIGKSLGAAPLVIIDHRLAGKDAPMLDLRQYSGAADVTPTLPTN